MHIKSLKQTASTPNPTGLYTPTNEQQKLKSKFWSKYLEDGGQVGDLIQLATVLRYVSHSKISEWWVGIAGLADWFSEQAEYTHRAEYLTMLAQDTLEQVMADRNAPPQARIAASKIVLEAAGKLGKTQLPKEQADGVGDMTREQLVEFIAKNVQRLPSVRKQLTVDVESDTVIPDGTVK